MILIDVDILLMILLEVGILLMILYITLQKENHLVHEIEVY